MQIDIKQLEFIHPALRTLLLWLEAQTGEQPTITSLYRINDKGVHGTLPLRGTDIRCRDKQLGEGIVSLVNSTWQYDPARPKKKCAILHGTGYNMHIHLQVHPATQRKQGGYDE